MVQNRLSHSSDTTAEPSPATTTYHQNEDIIKAFSFSVSSNILDIYMYLD